MGVVLSAEYWYGARRPAGPSATPMFTEGIAVVMTMLITSVRKITNSLPISHIITPEKHLFV